MGGTAITSAEYAPSDKTMQALRDQLAQNTQILASLDPESDTYHRLAARIQHQTDQLLAYEDQLERQRRATQQAMIEQYHRDQEMHTRIGGFFSLTAGAIVTYAGWGTWWLILGIVLILLGLCGMFTKDI